MVFFCCFHFLPLPELICPVFFWTVTDHLRTFLQVKGSLVPHVCLCEGLEWGARSPVVVALHTTGDETVPVLSGP